jgi:hypothetical protein
MVAVSNNLHLNELLSSIKSSRITIVKSDAGTGLTSRYLPIIMMVVYSTRRLLTRECACRQWQVKDKRMYTAMLYFGLALSSNLLLGIDWTWPNHPSVCPYSIPPTLTNWSGQTSALSDPLLDIPTILTYSLPDGDSEHLWNACQFVPATQCSVLTDYLDWNCFCLHF